MKVSLDRWTSGPALFFTPGNLPTQLAYSLSDEDVVSAFVVALLRSDQVLLAGSFYFESSATRALVTRFPTVWRSQEGRGLFFINANYPAFLDHGLGKREKSPEAFDPYSDLNSVRQRAGILDGLGLVGQRQDLDISATLREAWIKSCTSNDPDSVGAVLAGRVAEDQHAAAVVACVSLAEHQHLDFIWPAIAMKVRQQGVLQPIEKELQRAHADLYSRLMSVTLGAIETSPSITRFAQSISVRSSGNLGLFASVLRRVGIDPRALGNEDALLKMLSLDELQFLRSLDDEIVAATIDTTHSVNDYWRGIGLMEGAPLAKVSDSQIRQALTRTFQAIGIDPKDQLISKIATIERLYKSKFLTFFRARVEEILAENFPKTTAPKLGPTTPKDKLLFIAADPDLGRPTMRTAADLELRDIQNALDSVMSTSSIELVSVTAFSRDDIIPTVLKHRPPYLHFSGHGDVHGNVLVEGAGTPTLLKIRDLLAALAEVVIPVRCVTFCSCYSASALDDILHLADYIIVATSKVAPRDARLFSKSFYLAVASGLPIEQSFSLGQMALRQDGRDTAVFQLHRRHAMEE